MPYKPGPKELQLAAMKSGVFRQFKTEGKPSKPNTAPVQASAPIKETTVKKRKAVKAKKTKAKKLHLAIKSITSTDHKTTRITAKPPEQRLAEGKAQIAKSKKARKAKGGDKKPVTAFEVAEFMARSEGHKDAPLGGASMEELVAEFGIEAHPMRAKVHYIKTKLNWTVEHDGGRYRATPPAGYERQHALKA